MKFYCAEDIERLAGQGKTELVLDENTTLTDLARDAARQLGITIVIGARSVPSIGNVRSPTPGSPVQEKGDLRSSRDSVPKLGAKPKGCQHGLALASRPVQTNGHQNPDSVVDQLVELVKQTARQRSGN